MMDCQGISDPIIITKEFSVGECRNVIDDEGLEEAFARSPKVLKTISW